MVWIAGLVVKAGPVIEAGFGYGRVRSDIWIRRAVQAQRRENFGI